jgi:histo-blood group ABO system transferase
MKKNVLWVIALLLLPLQVYSVNVGFCIMATGKYIAFVQPLIDSARIFFLPEENVTFFVFTDQKAPVADDIVSVYQQKLGWPYDTMMRFETYSKHAALFIDQDYLFSCDADMRFVDTVGHEVLGKHMATLHPQQVGLRGPYDTNKQSLACVGPHEGEYYFCGGFYGGERVFFLESMKILSDRIQDDLKRGVIARQHDESHWNRYCIDTKPTVILNPSYCYPESFTMSYPKKLLALDKNHDEMRNG